jgi:hypothetical protein
LIALVQQLKAAIERLEQENQNLQEDAAQSMLRLQVAHAEEIQHVQQESAKSLAVLQEELKGTKSHLEITSSCVTGWKEQCQRVEHERTKAMQEQAACIDALEKQIAEMKKQVDHDACISSEHKVKSQDAAADLHKVKAAHAEALAAA